MCIALPAISIGAPSPRNRSSPNARTDCTNVRANRSDPPAPSAPSSPAVAFTGGNGLISASINESRTRCQRANSSRHTSPSPAANESTDAAVRST
ncbi:hypothetical protein K7G98_22525, partial [Saccharothrix sp. MB29]|nr:hypothetical protein [Saccharothrix sp. MB29]